MPSGMRGATDKWGSDTNLLSNKNLFSNNILIEDNKVHNGKDKSKPQSRDKGKKHKEK